MSNLVFMVEERSMQEVLKQILPKLLGETISYRIVPHSGKTDLLKSIQRKLRAWGVPDTRFVILIDQDSNDCIELKQRIKDLCSEAGRPETLVRIVCRCLEAWFIGDFDAIEAAYTVSLTRYRNRAKYREPDLIVNPVDELDKLLGGYSSKIKGARNISKHISVDSNRSRSFRSFVSGLERLKLSL